MHIKNSAMVQAIYKAEDLVETQIGKITTYSYLPPPKYQWSNSE